MGRQVVRPLGLGCLALLALVSAVGMARTPYDWTFAMPGRLGLLGFPLLIILLPRQGAGWVACWNGIRARSRRQPPDWETWAARNDAMCRSWQLRWLLPALFVLNLVVWAYSTYTNYTRVDMSSIRIERARSLAEELKARLFDTPVDEIIVILTSEPYPVGIRLRPGTPHKSLKQTRERVEEALSHLDAKGEWLIKVCAPDGSKTESRCTIGETPEEGASNAH